MPSQDHYFEIGSTHKVCEDYAMSGVFKTPQISEGSVNYYNEWQYAIVCDGCSSGSNSDLASRLIALGARSVMQEAISSMSTMYHRDNTGLALEGYMQTNLKREFLAMANAVHIHPSDFLSTLMMAVKSGGSHFVFWLGDGVLYMKEGDREEIVHRSYPSNAPMYPAYWQNDNYLAEYKKESPKCIEKHYVYKKQELVEHRESVVSSTAPYVHCPDWDLGITCPEMIAMFSDGIETFRGYLELPTVEEIPMLDVLRDCVAFKNCNGEFVTRRCRAVIRKLANQNGAFHEDDFSMAAIYNEPED